MKRIMKTGASKVRTIEKSQPASRRAPRPGRTVPGSLRGTAYELIKHEIMTCALAPGEYVNESALCSRLKLGRTPVNQALHRLMLEGLVDIMPRKGVIVKPVSLDEVMHIIEVRLLTETYCVRLVAERATEADIAELVANAFEFGCRARMEFSDRILFRFACGTGWLRRTVQ